jgi:CheY-like chemotaxis protein
MPRILIVNGNVAAASALASLVEAAGHGEARVASSGQAALALAATFVPTFVLLRLDLPDMSGYDVARQLSQHPRLQNLRLIALTGSSEHPGREQAREAGFERYLIDPPGAAELDGLFS